ncbi:MAG: glycosyltransferase family 4 protein [bacterium]
MKILHVTPYFPPGTAFGGTPEAVFALARAQMELGHDVLVLTTDASFLHEQKREGLEISQIAQPSIRAIGYLDDLKIIYVKNKIPSLVPYKFFTPKLVHPVVLSSLPDGIDVVHFHEVNISGYKKLAQHALSLRARIVISPHGSFAPPTHTGIRKILHRFLDPLYQKHWLAHAAFFVAVSSLEKKQLLEMNIPESNIHTLPLGEPELFRNQHRSEVPVPPSPYKTFLYLGRISKQKGALLLVHTFEELLNKGFPGRLILCGRVEDRTSAFRRYMDFHAPDRPGIFIIPPVSNTQIIRLFQITQATVCPSPYESFGLVPVESLKCGVPVIITEAYGCLEFLNRNQLPLVIIPVNHPAALSDALESFSIPKNPNPENHLLPSWKEVAQKLVTMYTQAGVQK